MEFWILSPPESSKKLATWTAEMDFEDTIRCSSDPGHQRSGVRKPKLKVNLPAKCAQEIIWTWYSECLITDRVLDVFRTHQFSGFCAKNAEGTIPDGSLIYLNELIITGWGGMAQASSGIHLLEYCETCKHRVYSNLSDPSRLLDETQWDGSDFFLIWPMPRYVMITDRVRQAILDAKIIGARFTKIRDLKPKPEGTLTPGPLSHWFSPEQAERLGKLIRI